MPNGNRGKRTRRNGGTLKVRWKGTVRMQGHQRDEAELRQRVYHRLFQLLSECEQFTTAGLTEKYARRIASEAKFLPTRGPSWWTVRDFGVVYVNPPKHWKWWIAVDSYGHSVASIGDFAAPAGPLRWPTQHSKR